MLRAGGTALIAEAGVNHNGSLPRALEMVDVAARAGADAIKFQSFKAELLATSQAPKAQYQVRGTSASESQLDMLRALELDRAAHHALAARCRERGIAFLSTPFDLDSLALLAGELQMPMLKISSGDLTNGPLLHAAARTGKSVLLSTGMATLEEIGAALAVLAHGYVERDAAPSAHALAEARASAAGMQAVRDRVTLLQCTTEYPAAPGDLNLRAMGGLKARFGTRIGFSDHSTGIEAAIAAAALGAEVIEKHFTLDRALPGPDHAASVEPAELARLVEALRIVELALGSGEKAPAAAELRNVAAARKSLVAARDVRRGEAFTADNLAAMRPGTGLSPLKYWDWIGRAAGRDYRAGELVDE